MASPRAAEGKVAITTPGFNAGTDGIPSTAPTSPPPAAQIHDVAVGGSSPDTNTSSRQR
jgi:hypothetical protein